MKNPFKFLDAYTEKDADFFFGRDTETEALYEFVGKNKIVLVYGYSGTGKTSLVRCGLSKKFGNINWLPVIIRRGVNIVRSIEKRLKQKLENIKGKSLADNTGDTAIFNTIEYLSAYYIRPVFLIFDQFEEFLLMAKEEEQQEFARILHTLKNSTDTGYCNVIIVVREEFLGLLDKFEMRYIPGLSDRKLRVDPMQETDIKDVISQTFDYPPFHITIQEDRETNINKIFDTLADQKREVPLPYLQVYLDQVWKASFEDMYPRGFSGDDYPHVTITTDWINKLSEFKNVLQKFLTEQKKKIRQDLELEFEKEFKSFDTNFLNDLLNEFVSDYGTKIPINYDLVGDQYVFPNSNRKIFDSFSPGFLKLMIDKLEKSKILRKESKTLELSHDMLAKLIEEQRGEKERREVRLRVITRLYMSTGETIPYNLIADSQTIVNSAGLNAEERKYYDESKRKGIQELRKEETIKKRRVRKISVIVVVAVSIILLLSIMLIKWLAIADSYYALNYAHTDIKRFSDPADRLKLLNYLYYFRDNYVLNTKEILKNNILALARDENIQGQLANVHYELDESYVSQPGSFSMSADGQYVVIQNDPEGGSALSYEYVLFKVDRTMQPGLEKIASFPDINYAYFIEGTDSLLIARTVARDSVTLQFKQYPNQFRLFNYRDTARSGPYSNLPQQGLLFDVYTLLRKNRSAYDNLYLKYSRATRTLVVPYAVVYNDSGSYTLEGKVQIRNNGTARIYNSKYSVGISRDGRYMLFGEGRGRGQIRINYVDLSQKTYQAIPLNDTRNDAFDFTADSRLWMISDSLFRIFDFRTQEYVFQKSFDSTTLKYAYAGGRGKNVFLIDNEEQYYILNPVTQALKKIPGKLIGKDDAMQNLVFKVSGIDSDSLVAYSTDGGLDGRYFFVTNEVVEGCVLNPVNGFRLVQIKKTDNSGRELHVIDDSMRLKAVFTLSDYNTYGFNKQGDVLYYVNGNSLALFHQYDSLVNLQDFAQFENWFKASANSHPAPFRQLWKASGLMFPSQRWRLQPRKYARFTKKD